MGKNSYIYTYCQPKYVMTFVNIYVITHFILFLMVYNSIKKKYVLSEDYLCVFCIWKSVIYSLTAYKLADLLQKCAQKYI